MVIIRPKIWGRFVFSTIIRGSLMTLSFSRLGTAALGLVLLTTALPAAAADLIMRNRSPDRLTLFVNDKKACVAEPNKDCTAQVEMGVMNLRATSTRGISTYDRLPIENATTIWTVGSHRPTTSGPGEAPPAQ